MHALIVTSAGLRLVEVPFELDAEPSLADGRVLVPGVYPVVVGSGAHKRQEVCELVLQHRDHPVDLPLPPAAQVIVYEHSTVRGPRWR